MAPSRSSTRLSGLDQLPVTHLRGVGSQLRDKLAKLGICSVQDLLLHLPLRYLDRTRITPIGALQPGLEAVLEGEVRGCDLVHGRRRSLMCRLQDRTGTVTLRFFHFSNSQRQNLATGTRLRCYGEVRLGSSGLELYHPEYQYLEGQDSEPLEQNLTPVYPGTEGLTQQRLRAIVGQALDLMKQHSVPDLLPPDTGVSHWPWPSDQWSLAQSLCFLHRPPADAPLALLDAGHHPAQQRLAFEELLAHHLSLLRLRQRLRQQQSPRLPRVAQRQQELLAILPFALTSAQQRVVAEIAADMAQPRPMLRLVQGDVGSGKTVVAATAALQTIANDYQAVVMAPTEILAEQHRINLESWFRPMGIRCAWLTGKLKGRAREVQLAAIADGSAQLIIGTHALFQDAVQFRQLGLCVIDEQHRFGVHQRLTLRQKGGSHGIPHQLIMTATPIPRTLAMSAYADLDCSVIDELPPGRTPVNTVAIADTRRQEVVDRVRNACREGRQVYWVCTLIEDSEVLEAQAAEATAAELKLLLPELNVGLVHGRLKTKDKQQVMSAFQGGNLQLLVATTVIEVGVDVPNASLMVIENPERLGLAQLHQLRGRVGRGKVESHCVLMFGSPLSQQARERIAIMRRTSDGFQIAEQDLKMRGPGEVLGTRQTGEMRLHIADLERDSHMLASVRKTADTLLASNPDRVEPLIQRWLGDRERFAQA